MRLTRASDYALRVLIHLPHPEGTGRTTREEIVRNTGAPPAFLNKLIQRLVRAGFVSSRPGVRGGCVLAVPADCVSVLQVIESIDGPLRISECVLDATACPRCSSCKLRRLLSELRDETVRVLSAATVADLANGDAGAPVSAHVSAKENPCTLRNI